MALQKIELCTIGPCTNEAEGACYQCGRLLCFIHSFPDEKQRYCYDCYMKRIKQKMDSRALRDW